MQEWTPDKYGSAPSSSALPPDEKDTPSTAGGRVHSASFVLLDADDNDDALLGQ